MGCFVLIWLEKVLMHVVIVVNKGLLEREFDCVGGRFIRRIDPSKDSHRSVLILWIILFNELLGYKFFGIEKSR